MNVLLAFLARNVGWVVVTCDIVNLQLAVLRHLGHITVLDVDVFCPCSDSLVSGNEAHPFIVAMQLAWLDRCFPVDLFQDHVEILDINC